MSNTEQMVSVPRHIGKEPLDGSHYVAECIRCGWVGSSGELTEDAQCTRVEGGHMCLGDTDEIEASRLLSIVQAMVQPAAQHQDEPTAWLDPNSGRKANTIGHAVKMHNEKVGGAPATVAALYTVPLYTRANAGEVERLKDDVLSLSCIVEEVGKELSILRDQLAGRDALLRETSGELHDFITCGLLDRIDAAISARAEPEVKP